MKWRSLEGMDQKEILYTNTQNVYSRDGISENTPTKGTYFVFSLFPALPVCLPACLLKGSHSPRKRKPIRIILVTVESTRRPKAHQGPREWLLESWVIGPPPSPKMLSHTNLLYSLISSIIFRTFVTSLSPITRICICFF